MDKKKNRIIAIALSVTALLLAAFGIIALPDDIVIQFTSSGDVNKVSKYIGLMIPFLITVVFSFLFAIGEDETVAKKHIIGAVLGLLLFLVTIGINL
ncbi:MAG: hypothetical protein ACI4S4_06100 [Candidatus Ornithospirochaeta sp.]